MGAPRATASRRRWSAPWSQVVAGLVVLAGLCIMLYPQAASWFSQREQSRVTETARRILEEPPLDDELYRAAELERAHSYNRALASGALVSAGERIPTGNGTSSDESLDYDDLLNVGGTGFMGRLQYEALAIDLPIYHGTSDETLLRGVGHLEGSSLPVGGVGTRAVLTAHRGLPTATLFNDLDKASPGDLVTVSVLDEVLTYQVVQTQVIEPDATEAIWPDPERDLITLVTCTPLGINSHRILVTAERVTPTPPQQAVAATEDPDLPGFPWWAVILGAGVTGFAVYVWRAGYSSSSGSSGLDGVASRPTGRSRTAS